MLTLRVRVKYRVDIIRYTISKEEISMRRNEIIERLYHLSTTEDEARRVLDLLLLDKITLSESILYVVRTEELKIIEDKLKISRDEIRELQLNYFREFRSRLKGKKFLCVLDDNIQAEIVDIREIHIALSSLMTHQLLDRDVSIEVIKAAGSIACTSRLFSLFTSEILNYSEIISYLKELLTDVVDV